MSAQAVQLTLDLPFDERMSRNDFVVGASNRAALDFVDLWPDWPANVAILTGPAGSGKTHLSNIWAEASGALRHRAKNLDIETFPQWLLTGALVLEDADVHGVDETAFFHLVNTFRVEGGYLLITAESPVGEWGLMLADLSSRLRAAVPVEIGAPDDVLLAQVLVKQFADRQLMVAPDVVAFLVARMERSLNAARETVNRLDDASLTRGRAITKRFAGDVLGY